MTFRLLSAFRDKFERCTTTWDCTKKKDWQVFNCRKWLWTEFRIFMFRYFQRQGRGIVKKYRKLALNKFGQNFFSEEYVHIKSVVMDLLIQHMFIFFQ